ncbi:hypothetical protein ACMH5Q_11270 [Aquirufa lenticrescens]
MLNSLKKSLDVDFKLFILCLDDEVYRYFEGNSDVIRIKLTDIESNFPELLNVKDSRKFNEYIFTLSPFLPLYILNNYKFVDRITSLDADLFFLNSPKYVLDELGNNLIGITSHGFSSLNQNLEIYGRFNVSFQSFPNTDAASNCLLEWANNCLDFCGDYINSNSGMFADQKYLDDWQQKYDFIKVFGSPQIGLAPWNVPQYKLLYSDSKFCIEGSKSVIFYHFHNFRIRSSYLALHGISSYGLDKLDRGLLVLYRDYWKLIDNVKISNFDDGLRFNYSSFTGQNNILRDLAYLPVLIRFKSIVLNLDLRYIFRFILKFKKIWPK